MEPTDNQSAPASEQSSDQTSQSPAPDASASAPQPEAQPDASAPAPEPDIKPATEPTAQAQPVILTLSVGDLISRAEARLAEIRDSIAKQQDAIAAFAETAARDGATADTMAQISEAEDNIKEAFAERSAIEETLVPLRAAVAKVEAEQAAAAAEASRAELAHSLTDLVAELLENARDKEAAFKAVAATTATSRQLRKQFRDAIAEVVPNQQQRGVISNLAEVFFTETPSLEQFIRVDASIIDGSGAVAADRAQKVLDRIAEATA